jgi:toxin ParE1/3/4
VRKRAVHYTTAAEADIEAIAEYTLRVWGEEQREFYLALLEECCEGIIPTRLHFARPVPHYPTLRSWRVEHHVVYFRRSQDGIEIVRILHERQVPARHLKR